jgi:hypothetical protein
VHLAFGPALRLVDASVLPSSCPVPLSFSVLPAICCAQGYFGTTGKPVLRLGGMEALPSSPGTPLAVQEPALLRAVAPCRDCLRCGLCSRLACPFTVRFVHLAFGPVLRLRYGCLRLQIRPWLCWSLLRSMSYFFLQWWGIFENKKVGMRFINHFLETYGFDGVKGLLLSLFPSFKYDIQVPVLTGSALLAVVADVLGVGPVVAVAMLVAIVAEMWTGIKASRIRGIHIESFRFSRCILKLCCWLIIIYIINAFYMECSCQGRWFEVLAGVFFGVTKALVMIWFVVEHVISILENLAVIDGKPKEALVEKIEVFWDKVSDMMFKKVK